MQGVVRPDLRDALSNNCGAWVTQAWLVVGINPGDFMLGAFLISLVVAPVIWLWGVLNAYREVNYTGGR